MQAVKEFFKKLFSSVSLFLKKFFSKKMNVYITIGVSVLLVGLIVGLALAKPNNPNPTDNDDDQSGIIDDEDDEVIETNYNVTVSGSGSGDVNYGGLTQVVENGSLSLEFIPTDDFYLSALNINGQEFSNDEILNAVTEGYTISNITADVVVNYTFTLKPIVTSYTGEKIIPVANVFTIDTFDKYIWFMQVASNLGNPDITETGIASLPYSFMSKTINLEIDLDLYGFIVAPIGLGYPNRFEGTFDGKDHTIKNLKINGSYVNCALFGDTNFATIKNIVLENVDLNSPDKAAGIVAFSNNSTITNCTVSGNIYADGYAGGITAYGGGVVDCINYATVSSNAIDGLRYTAGITAYGGDITRCINYGTITGYRNVGGIVGLGNVITNCANYGEINALGLVAGGIVGVTDAGTISNCYNVGNVNVVGSYGGGIAGMLQNNPKLINCYNRGNITTGGYAGGIIGYFSYSSVTQDALTNCYNVGLITTSANTKGGIIGGYSSTFVEGVINTCYFDLGINPGLTAGYELTESDTLKGLSTLEMVSSGLESKGFVNDNWVFLDPSVIESKTYYYYPQIKVKVDSDNPLIVSESLDSVKIEFVDPNFIY